MSSSDSASAASAPVSEDKAVEAQQESKQTEVAPVPVRLTKKQLRALNPRVFTEAELKRNKESAERLRLYREQKLALAALAPPPTKNQSAVDIAVDRVVKQTIQSDVPRVVSEKKRPAVVDDDSTASEPEYITSKAVKLAMATKKLEKVRRKISALTSRRDENPWIEAFRNV